jgi:hypothetical protein
MRKIALSSMMFLTALVCLLLPALPAQALNDKSFVSANGSDSNSCTFSQPCATMQGALSKTSSTGMISCLDISDYTQPLVITISITIDCGTTAATAGPFSIDGSGITVYLRNLTEFSQFFGVAVIKGTVFIDNVVMTDLTQEAINAGPSEASKLVVSNSVFKNCGAGALLKPISGGSLMASFDHVTIANNSGGGLKTDTTNGPVTVDIFNSTISYNAGNGMNAVSGAGGANMLNIKNSVIAANGVAGIQANGANAAALVNNTVLDSNTAGATSAIGGGRILTYGNNSIVGTPGSGFTGSAPPQ